MSRYLLDAGARRDLREISEYIAKDNQTAAFRLRERFLDRFRMLADNPTMGELRDDLAPGVRQALAGNYVILFQPAEGGGVRILQVVHAARDLASVFRKPTAR